MTDGDSDLHKSKSDTHSDVPASFMMPGLYYTVIVFLTFYVSFSAWRAISHVALMLQV